MEVFQRYELKYLLDERQYDELMASAQSHWMPDRYPNTQIQNVYYDTPDFAYVRRSLEKPVYKEKLRLRCYQTPKADDTVFLELKKKYRGVVYKRRAEMTYQTAMAYLERGAPIEQPSQVIREINWMLAENPSIEPAMYLSYARTAYVDAEIPGVRLTFDRDIRWRREAIQLDAGIWGGRLLLPGQTLMELKLPAAMPLWLAKTLSRLEIYPASFSKYGRAFCTMLQETKEKGILLYA